MVTVWLIRHAEAQNNVNAHLVGGRSEQAPLSEQGMVQALRLRDRLAALDPFAPALVCASTALRARETARIALSAMAAPPPLSTHPDLHEWDQGQWEGLPRAETYTLQVREQLAAQPLDFQPPGGESPREVENRMWRWLNTDLLPALPAGSLALAFSHGMAIRSLLRRVLQADPAMTFRLVTHNTSISALVFRDGCWQVERINDYAHVSDLRLIGPY